MRWLVLVFLAPLLLASFGLAQIHWLYAPALQGQLMFYSTAVVGQVAPAHRALSLVRLAYFFCQESLAILQGGIRCVSGTRMTT